MGHRHLFNSSQILESDSREGLNQSEHTYAHFVRAGASEGSSFVYPVQNSVIDVRNPELQLNYPPRSGGLVSGALASQYQQYQPQPPERTYEPLSLTSTSLNNSMAQENYGITSSSSIHGGQRSHGTDGAVMNLPTTGRGQYKRNRHGAPIVYLRDSTSRYCDTGSSSSVPMSADSRQQQQVAELHQPQWDFSSSYGGHGVTFRSEDTPRNVRSRTSFDLEGNSSRTHFCPNLAQNSMSSVPIDLASLPNSWGQAPNMLSREWNHGLVNPSPHARPFVSDPGDFCPENHIIMANSNYNAAMDIGDYHGGVSFHQNPVPPCVQVNLNQSVRGIRSTYHQTSSPGIRASLSNLHPGNGVALDEGFPVAAHSYSGRHSRSHSTSVSRDRSGRARMIFRSRDLPDDVVVRNHFTPEGLAISDHSALYGSRALFDQHMDMRLDVDNMTYEELLSLGERIGTVNTGVCEDLMSNCLTESIFCSSDQPQEESRCVICLEEYKNMDDVGTLKLCGHDFHVQCIRKWLAVKNVCPICKSCALDDKMKNN